MDTRKQTILNHLALYRFSVRTIIEEHVIGGDASRDLHELKTGGHISVHERALNNGRSVYQLTPAEARRLGLPVSIAATPRPQALLANLSLLWFCFCGDTKRYRLSIEDQHKIFRSESMSTFVKGTYHVMEPRPGGSFIYRVYVPTARTGKHDVERALYGIASAAHRETNVSSFVAARRYGIAVVVHDENRAKAIRQFLNRRPRVSKPVHELIEVKVFSIPEFISPVRRTSTPNLKTVPSVSDEELFSP